MHSDVYAAVTLVINQLRNIRKITGLSEYPIEELKQCASI